MVFLVSMEMIIFLLVFFFINVLDNQSISDNLFSWQQNLYYVLLFLSGFILNVLAGIRFSLNVRIVLLPISHIIDRRHVRFLKWKKNVKALNVNFHMSENLETIVERGWSFKFNSCPYCDLYWLTIYTLICMRCEFLSVLFFFIFLKKLHSFFFISGYF